MFQCSLYCSLVLNFSHMGGARGGNVFFGRRGIFDTLLRTPGGCGRVVEYG